MEKKSGILREMLERRELIVAPGAYDALTARLVEYVGFKAVFHTGYGTAASLLGQPDVGLVCFKEMMERVGYMARAVNIPLLADGDTGYGNAINVYRTVKEYIWAGASGMFIEDQVWPKRCGHMEGKELISIDEMVGKIKAANDARNEEDPDFLLGARTDAIAVYGFGEAIKRANVYADAGADFVFVEAPINEEQVEKIPQLVKVPAMLNLIEDAKTPLIPIQKVRELGYGIVVYPLTTLYVATKSVLDALKSLKENGVTTEYIDKMIAFKEFAELIGLPEVRKMEDMYLPEAEVKRKYKGV